MKHRDQRLLLRPLWRAVLQFEVPPLDETVRFLFGKCGFIDRSGKMVITPQFTHAQDFCGGLAAVDGWCMADPATIGMPRPQCRMSK